MCTSGFLATVDTRVVQGDRRSTDRQASLSYWSCTCKTPWKPARSLEASRSATASRRGCTSAVSAAANLAWQRPICCRPRPDLVQKENIALGDTCLWQSWLHRCLREGQDILGGQRVGTRRRWADASCLAGDEQGKSVRVVRACGSTDCRQIRSCCGAVPSPPASRSCCMRLAYLTWQGWLGT